MDWLSALHVKNILYAIALLVAGWVIAAYSAGLTEKYGAKRFSHHSAILMRRLVFYAILIAFLISSLQQLGFNLTVLIGAAGIFTVAIGFASQTAASNLISGIFMICERPFSLGDTIEVKGITGTVESLDLLSTKLITPDNRLVRIPNETILKSEITNLSCLPTRRIDLLVGISYDNDIDKAKKVFLQTAISCPGVLNSPEPSVLVSQFADSSIELKGMVWVNRVDYSEVKSQLQERIKIHFDKEKIDIPYPQLSIRRVQQ